jgi:hypothetical protein
VSFKTSRLPHFLKIGAVALSFVVLNGFHRVAVSWMNPLKEGHAEEFWVALYQLRSERYRFFYGVYPSREGVCVYAIRGLHGEKVCWVKQADLEAQLPGLRSRILEESGRLSDGERDLIRTGAPLTRLIEARLKAEIEEWAKKDPDMAAYVEAGLKGFEVRWSRIQRYWINILAEGIFLNALLAVLWVPFLRREAHLSRAIVAAAVYLLILTPYFLGYCPWSFTSAGPSGGVLYPIILFSTRSRSEWTEIDQALLQSIGYPLEPFSQTPGPMSSVSGMGAPSPSSAMLTAAFLSIIVYLLSLAVPHVLHSARTRWADYRTRIRSSPSAVS